MMRDELYERATGRWTAILMQLGISHKYLDKRKNGPCPMCGGRDRWRFTDHEERGGWVCTHCGRGYGLDLVMQFKGVQFMEAIKLIESVIGGAPVSVKRSSDLLLVSKQRRQMMELWTRSSALTGADLASRYLKARYLDLDVYPACLRVITGLPYWGGPPVANAANEPVGWFTTLLARFVAPDDSASILQRIYLEEPGKKAEVPSPTRMMPGPIPEGGAVRLTPPAEEMGIAEGVESAFAASELKGVPVWACLSANGILKFKPPKACKLLHVFVDLDPTHTGQAAGETLCHRLSSGKDAIATQLHRPSLGPDVEGKIDWLDVLAHRRLVERGRRLYRRA